MGLNYSGGFEESVAELAEHEKAGLDIVFVPEAYSYDAVSQLGFIAARTERVEIASGILEIYTRTPSLTAMTAAGLDFVSGGRFTLGLGASGPQVIEGFHGVRYDAPIGRTREIIDICRQVWRREKVQYQGKHYTIPLPPEQGTGLGKPLKLINHPVRERSDPRRRPRAEERRARGGEGRGVAADLLRAGEGAGGLGRRPRGGQREARGGAGAARGLPAVLVLHHRGRGRRDPDARRDARVRRALRRGHGREGQELHNDVARRYGYVDEAETIQDLYLDGKKEQAAATVPEELLRAISLIGPRSYVAERMAAFAEAGVTTLNITPLAGTPAERVALVGAAKELASAL